MEIEHYVNLPADERREGQQQRGHHHSGWSKVIWLVGVSFGLLCIIQTALNVSLRLQAVGCSERCDNNSTGNVTMMSAGDSEVRDRLEKEKDQLLQEKKQLVQERDQLVKEKQQLVQERDQLVQERDQLVREKQQLVQERDQLVQEKQQLVREKKQLVREKQQLVQEKKQLVQEKDQLVQKRDHLTKENQELQADNCLLTEDKRMLNEKVTELQNTIEELVTKQNTPRCPEGWRMYMSTCYKHSSVKDTWEYAKQDCACQGSHLVIFDDAAEERAVLSFGLYAEVWMGLSGCKDPFNSWTWTRVDGDALSYENWNYRNSVPWRSRPCAYAHVDQGPWFSMTWFRGSCEEQHYWVCEKELHTS